MSKVSAALFLPQVSRPRERAISRRSAPTHTCNDGIFILELPIEGRGGITGVINNILNRDLVDGLLFRQLPEGLRKELFCRFSLQLTIPPAGHAILSVLLCKQNIPHVCIERYYCFGLYYITLPHFF